MSNNGTVFVSKINGIEFDVHDGVTAKLMRTDAKSGFVQEIDCDGSSKDNTKPEQGAGEIEIS